MDESELIRKLKLIEALHDGATTDGEKEAAADALRRFQRRLQDAQSQAGDRLVEYSFSMADQWRRKLFMALLRRHGIKPYRYPRQRYTAVMARVSKCVVDDILWPQYEQMSKALSHYQHGVRPRPLGRIVYKPSLTMGL